MLAAEVAFVVVGTTEAFRRVLAPLELTEDGPWSVRELVAPKVLAEHEAPAAVSASMLALLVGRVVAHVVREIGVVVEACVAVFTAVGMVAGPHLLLVAAGAESGR